MSSMRRPRGGFTVSAAVPMRKIRLSVFLPRRSLQREIAAYRPDAVHIATEGTLGLAARAICLNRNIPFTTSYHTRFPDYVRARFPFIPESLAYRFLRWFHAPATAMMVATPALAREMAAHGFRNVRLWSPRRRCPAIPADHGRVASIRTSHLALCRPHRDREEFSKPSCGSMCRAQRFSSAMAPPRNALERQFPQAKFLGVRTGDALAEVYSASDVFVFPSRTDTFGLVLLEALALRHTGCGLFPCRDRRTFWVTHL